MSKIVEIDRVADMLGVSVRTVQRHIKNNPGNFPGKQIGEKWVFDEAQIHEWVRGEWPLPKEKQTQRELIDAEAKRWGVDMPEVLVDLQQAKREKE